MSLRLITRLLLGITFVYLVWTAFRWSGDFMVYYRTAKFWWQGEPIYSVARDGIGAYKYPPWILPLFLPFAALPESLAKLAWALLSVGGVLWIFRSLKKRLWSRSSEILLIGCFLVTFNIWFRHFLDGQIPILVAALFLGFFEDRTLRRSSWKSTLLVWAGSTKIFTLLPLPLVMDWRSPRAWRNGAIAAASCLALGAGMGLRSGQSLLDLIQAWALALRQGNEVFGWDAVYGRVNQGLPGFLVRLLNVRSMNGQIDALFFMLTAVPLGSAWWAASRKRGLHPFETGCGWLALVPVVLPLSWWHGFALAFPLAVLAVDRALASKQARLVGLAVLALLALGAASQSTLGSTVGSTLEWISIKSWGVVLAGISVAMAAGKTTPEARSYGSTQA